jgi:hypothetical protein
VATALADKTFRNPVRCDFRGRLVYAKRTMKRSLPATRKRYAHKLANAARTNIQNEPRNGIQNADAESKRAGAK